MNNDDLVIITAHYNEDLSWLQNSKFKVIVSTNHPTYKGEGVDESLRAPINKGNEASAYIRYIINYYHELPPYMAFIHGHEQAWHQLYPGSLLDAISCAKRKDYGFISLGLHHMYYDVYPGNGTQEHIARIWPMFFEPYIGIPTPERIDHFDAGAQFIVSRERVKAIPLMVWVHWLFLLYDNSLLRTPTVFEWTWHIIFGEPVNYDEDELQYFITHFNHPKDKIKELIQNLLTNQAMSLTWQAEKNKNIRYITNY